MDHKSADVKRIHEYISSLDKVQEKKRRAKYLIGIPIGLFVLALIALLYFRPSLFLDRKPIKQSASLLQFEELNLSEIRNHFKEEDDALFVQVPEINEVVTLNSEQDYWQLLDEMALRFMEEEDREEEEVLESNSQLSSLSDTVSLNSPAKDPIVNIQGLPLASIVEGTRLLVNGKRITGAPHTFTVRNFRPELSYVLDLGNGVRREMQSPQIKYTYKRRGRFTAILRGSYQGEEVLSKKVFLSIRTAPRKEPVKKEEVILTNRETEPNSQAVEQTPVETSDVEVFEVSETRMDDAASAPEMEKPNGMISPGIDEAQAQVTETKVSRSVNNPGNSSTSDKPAKKTIAPLMVASQMPSFPGGKVQMLEYLNTRIKYPQPARDFHVEGIVYVQFVVQADGSHTDHKVLKGLGYGCNEEALRITKAMPKWSPGRQQGEEVPVLFTLPVNFQLIK